MPVKLKVSWFDGKVVQEQVFFDKYSALVFMSNLRPPTHSGTLYLHTNSEWKEVSPDRLDEELAVANQKVICG